MILQAPALILGATKTEEEAAVPWECQKGNHQDLIGTNHNHRFFNYSGSHRDKIHENTPQYSVGYENWFRFRLVEATRMLERNELTKEFKKVNPVGVICAATRDKIIQKIANTFSKKLSQKIPEKLPKNHKINKK